MKLTEVKHSRVDKCDTLWYIDFDDNGKVISIIFLSFIPDMVNDLVRVLRRHVMERRLVAGFTIEQGFFRRRDAVIGLYQIDKIERLITVIQGMKKEYKLAEVK